jgi:hypothetical protein
VLAALAVAVMVVSDLQLKLQRLLVLPIQAAVAVEILRIMLLQVLAAQALLSLDTWRKGKT